MHWRFWVAGSIEVGQESEFAADSHGGDSEDAHADAYEAVRAVTRGAEREPRIGLYMAMNRRLYDM